MYECVRACVPACVCVCVVLFFLAESAHGSARFSKGGREIRIYFLSFLGGGGGSGGSGVR